MRADPGLIPKMVPEIIRYQSPVVHMRRTAAAASAFVLRVGIHRCVGNRLAETQLTILWKEILKRFPPIEVVEKPKRAYSNLIHGITEMKVRIPA